MSISYWPIATGQNGFSIALWFNQHTTAAALFGCLLFWSVIGTVVYFSI